MFLSDILNEKKQSTPAFTKEPIISRLSHSFNDTHWSHPYHIHKQETELMCFSQRKVGYQISNKIFHISEGGLLIMNKDCIHFITSDYEDPISCWACAITGSTMANTKAADCFLSLDKKPYVHTEEHKKIIADIFETLKTFSQQKTQSSATIRNTLANALVHICFHIFRDTVTDRKRKKSTFIQDILFYINGNYASDIMLKELTEHFHISNDYISHKFKEAYGIPPTDYMTGRQISEVKWMLINTSDPLISISSQVGYDSTTHFARLFLKRVDYPPLEYRRCFGMKISSEEQKGCLLSFCDSSEKIFSQTEGDRIGKKTVCSVITPMMVDDAVTHKKASS